MTTSSKSAPPLRYHPDAYRFVMTALPYAQKLVERTYSFGMDQESAHISGPELLQGIRELALEHFGLLTISVLRVWGIESTGDFGRIVFELIDRGELRKTEQDDISDFYEVYDFAEAFDQTYEFDLTKAFQD